MKILKELDELEKEGVITPETAVNIREYVLQRQKTQSQSSLLLTILGVIGSILIGMGLISILAHNWDNLPKIVKTSIALFPLLLGQVICGYLLLTNKKNWLNETASAFTAIAVGLSIAMVHQVYNLLENHISDFILIWILLALPLIYVMNSKATALLFLIGSSTFNVVGVEHHHWIWSLALLYCILPFYYRTWKRNPAENFTVVFHWGIVISIFSMLIPRLIGENNLTITLLLLLWSYIYVGIFLQDTVYYNAYKITAIVGLVILSFWFYVIVKPWNMLHSVALLASILQIGAVGYRTYKKKEEFDFIKIFPALLFVSSLLWNYFLFELLIFALGTWYLVKGLKTNRFLLVNFGLLVISSKIIQWILDDYLPFLFRGLIFISLGIVFFVVNYLIMKKGKKNE